MLSNNLVPQTIEAAIESGTEVVIWTTNGFMMRGTISAFDREALMLEVPEGRKLIFLSAISTILSPGAEAPCF